MDAEYSTFTDQNGNNYSSVVKAKSSTGLLQISNPNDTHTNTHELFHNLIHNHPNAPPYYQNLINPNNQEAGHANAGGIFIYGNASTGVSIKNLSQQNLDDALKVLPAVDFNKNDLIQNRLILGSESQKNKQINGSE
jgi:hypothetical protein